MCRDAIVIRGTSQIFCQTQSDLEVALGCQVVIRRSYPKDALDPVGCICPVDPGRTAKRAGAAWRDAGEQNGWDGELIFVMKDDKPS